jgi:hypothetical protein
VRGNPHMLLLPKILYTCTQAVKGREKRSAWTKAKMGVHRSGGGEGRGKGWGLNN